jgi:hypothetical protein
MASSSSPTKSPTTSQEDVEAMKQRIVYLNDQLKKYMHLQHRVTHGESETNDSDEDVPRRRSPKEERFDFKVEIPEFVGNLDPEVFLDWMQTVERVFDLKDVDDNKKVKYVSLKLRKHASIWWTNLQKKREAKGKDKVRSWDKMKKKLQEKFLPPSYLRDNYYKLQKLVQGGRSVEEYTVEFEHLLWRCDLKEDEPQTLVRYLFGLNDWIRHVVELQPYKSLDELSSLSLKVERQRKVLNKYQTPQESSYSTPPSHATTKPPILHKKNSTKSAPIHP